MFKKAYISFKMLCFGLVGAVLLSVVCQDLIRSKASNAGVLNLPSPTQLLRLSGEFESPVLRGIKINPENPYAFDFIFDKGDARLGKKALEKEAKRMINYFLAALAIPQEDMWVNLSPYEADRILPEALNETEFGRDMLAQDYILKQLSSSLTHPDSPSGEAYWSMENRNSKIENRNDFNKIWIVPDKANIYEDATRAIVADATLKVQSQGDKSVLIPELTREVNQGKHFEQLRQMYNSILLAYWFKQKVRNSIFAKSYVDRSNVKGIDTEDKKVKEEVYQRYLKSVQKGVYDIIKKDKQKPNKRRYFSGGLAWNIANSAITLKPLNQAPEKYTQKGNYIIKGEMQRQALNNDTSIAASAITDATNKTEDEGVVIVNRMIKKYSSNKKISYSKLNQEEQTYIKKRFPDNYSELSLYDLNALQRLFEVEASMQTFNLVISRRDEMFVDFFTGKSNLIHIISNALQAMSWTGQALFEDSEHEQVLRDQYSEFMGNIDAIVDGVPLFKKKYFRHYNDKDLYSVIKSLFNEIESNLSNIVHDIETTFEAVDLDSEDAERLSSIKSEVDNLNENIFAKLDSFAVNVQDISPESSAETKMYFIKNMLEQYNDKKETLTYSKLKPEEQNLIKKLISQNYGDFEYSDLEGLLILLELETEIEIPQYTLKLSKRGERRNILLDLKHSTGTCFQKLVYAEVLNQESFVIGAKYRNALSISYFDRYDDEMFASILYSLGNKIFLSSEEIIDRAIADNDYDDEKIKEIKSIKRDLKFFTGYSLKSGMTKTISDSADDLSLALRLKNIDKWESLTEWDQRLIKKDVIGELSVRYRDHMRGKSHLESTAEDLNLLVKDCDKSTKDLIKRYCGSLLSDYDKIEQEDLKKVIHTLKQNLFFEIAGYDRFDLWIKTSAMEGVKDLSDLRFDSDDIVAGKTLDLYEKYKKTIPGKSFFSLVLEALKVDIPGYEESKSEFFSSDEIWKSFLQRMLESIDKGDIKHLSDIDKFELSIEEKAKLAYKTIHMLDKGIMRSVHSKEDSTEDSMAGALISRKFSDLDELFVSTKEVMLHALKKLHIAPALANFSEDDAGFIDTLRSAIENAINSNEGLALRADKFSDFDVSGTIMTGQNGKTRIELFFGEAETAVNSRYASNFVVTFDDETDEMEAIATYDEVPYEFTLNVWGDSRNFGLKNKSVSQIKTILRSYPQYEGKVVPLEIERIKEIYNIVGQIKARVGFECDFEFGLEKDELIFQQLRPMLGDFKKTNIKPSADLIKKESLGKTPFALGKTTSDGLTAHLVLIERGVSQSDIEDFEKNEEPYFRLADDVLAKVAEEKFETKAIALLGRKETTLNGHAPNSFYKKISSKNKYVHGTGPGIEKAALKLNYTELAPGIWKSINPVTIFSDGSSMELFANELENPAESTGMDKFVKTFLRSHDQLQSELVDENDQLVFGFAALEKFFKNNIPADLLSSDQIEDIVDHLELNDLKELDEQTNNFFKKFLRHPLMLFTWESKIIKKINKIIFNNYTSKIVSKIQHNEDTIKVLCVNDSPEQIELVRKKLFSTDGDTGFELIAANSFALINNNILNKRVDVVIADWSGVDINTKEGRNNLADLFHNGRAVKLYINSGFDEEYLTDELVEFINETSLDINYEIMRTSKDNTDYDLADNIRKLRPDEVSSAIKNENLSEFLIESKEIASLYKTPVKKTKHQFVGEKGSSALEDKKVGGIDFAIDGSSSVVINESNVSTEIKNVVSSGYIFSISSIEKIKTDKQF